MAAQDQTDLDGALGLLESRNWSAARVVLERVLSKEPASALAHQELGWLLYGRFEEAVLAKQHLLRATELDSSLPLAQMFLAVVLASLGEHEDAQRCFWRAIVRSEDPTIAHATFADYFATQGALTDAEAHFQRALELQPDCALALRDYARLLASIGRLDEAEQLFRRALSVCDDEWGHYWYSAFLADSLDRKSDAVVHLRIALRQSPENEQISDLLKELEGG